MGKISTKEAVKLVKDSSVIDTKGQGDTIRLWENYRDQAILWRSIALLQIPATALALIFALVMWSSRQIILNVPHKPQPGTYAAQDIPDSEFIDNATNFLNLVVTYNPSLARKQFDKASEMVREPLLSRYKVDIMQTELQTIEATSRTQVFYADPTLTKVERVGAEVKVTMTGERQKFISGKEVPSVANSFTVVMTTMPKNLLNPYGIVITDFSFEEVRK